MLQCKIFSIIGLTLDVIGVIMLYKFGLSSILDEEGADYIIAEEPNEIEIKKWRKYNCFSKIASGLIILGFIFQLLAVIVTL